MSELTEKFIKDLSHLCRIEVSAEEIQDLFRSLKQVLDHFDKLQEIDLSDLPPYCHVEEQGIENLRDDVVGTQIDRKLFLANAPDHIGGMIKVPTIIKQSP